MADTLARMRQLVGTSAQWAANDLIVGAGELALERAAGGAIFMKAGDGLTRFSLLPYMGPAGPASQVSFIGSMAGAVPRDAQSKMRDIVDARDVGVDPAASDNSAALAKLIATVCAPGAPWGMLPPGTINYGTPLAPSYQYCNLRGHGKNQTVLNYTGATGDCIAPIAMTSFKPCWSDFIVTSSTTTGRAINFSNVTSQVYDGYLESLTLSAAGGGLYAPRIFSMRMSDLRASSSAGHAFHANCGPSVTWNDCYAVSAGPGKAGYRMAGLLHAIGCNGVDNAERIWVLGSNPGASDGFQNDFPGVTDYVIALFENCNCEFFDVNAITLVNGHRFFNWVGGKFDRSAKSTPYESMLTVRASGVNAATPIRLNPAFYIAGSGVANGGIGATGAQFFISGGGTVVLVDETGGVLGKALDMSVSGGTQVPMVAVGVLPDVFGGRALKINAISPTRLNIAWNRYTSPAALTPVGTNQAINVTGFCRWSLSPAAAASISSATFTQTVGADLDNGRTQGSDLILEATNANSTIVHSASGANTFRLTGAANIAMATGAVLRFHYSTTSSQWIQG